MAIAWLGIDRQLDVKRLIIVYSPNSTSFSEVEREVIVKSRKIKGWMVAKFEVKEASVRDNASRLAKIIRKGDLVLSVGGDGTATMSMNAVIKSEEIATLAVMPFGNFNDFAETLGRMSFEQIIRRFEEERYIDFYPLDIRVNKKHYAYSGLYFTIGMMAEAVGVLKRPRVRRELLKARNRMRFSARKLFGWYIKNKHRTNFLPSETKLNGLTLAKGTTDYVAMNGSSLAGVVPGGMWYRSASQFWSGTMRNRSLFRMFRKFMIALGGDLPGKESKDDVLTFDKLSSVYVLVEGEGEKLDSVSEISVSKSEKGLRVIRA